MSLLDIKECDIPPQNVNKSLKYILIQINEFKGVRVIQCKVEIDRTVKKCGMFSHIMDVKNGKYLYVQETSREACKRMYILDYFQMGRLHNRIKIEFIRLSISHISRQLGRWILQRLFQSLRIMDRCCRVGDYKIHITRL